MPLLDQFMPSWSLRQVDRVAVAAGPSEAWKTVRAVDAFQLPFARLLFEMRAVPERLRARLARRPLAPARSLRIDDIPREGPGFRVLGEDAGREVVVGSVGKFWKPAIEFATVEPADFAAFDRPGFGKVAWCLRVDPRAGGGSWVGFDVRVSATDEPSLKSFKFYWLVIGQFSHAIRHALLARFVAALGAAGGEDTRALPGDELLHAHRFQKTHAVTIEAPPDKVWPWILQMGAGRAGWYSYDLLDNGGTPSAREIIPSLQHLSIGEIIPALPKIPGGFAVLWLEPGRALVLGDPSLASGEARTGWPPWHSTWAFVLEAIGADATRLLVRVRAEYEPDLKTAVLVPIVGTLHEVMERRQLHNLRARAEVSRTP